MMNRRDVLGLAIAAGAASAVRPATARSEGNEAPRFRIVDSNVSLFRWPFHRLPLDDPDLLVKKLRSLGIAQAWAGSFEGLLHRDLAGVNRRLAEACRRHPELIPIGSINLELPGWEQDLTSCITEHSMPGVRLHPNYHGYTLDDPRFVSLLKSATKAGRFVQIASAMEDVRTQHNLVRVPDVDLAPLPEIVAGLSEARVQILNHRLRSPLLDQLAKTPGVYFDTARVDSTDGVPKLVDAVPPGRVLFGTHAPFLVPEAALIRVHESGVLDDSRLNAVLAGNADRFSGKLKA
ncbi:MAG: amidohydrolase family protein [Planctomycetota bacterium]|nr:amidohydrolase family protein [Planctomycetota bacterium]MDA1251545.1 amidohydrolase family protein [Planctomycetota bacterium]